MKKIIIEYKVTYVNDVEQLFYTDSIVTCFCLAVVDANSKGHDSRIRHIYDTVSKITYADFELFYKEQS